MPIRRAALAPAVLIASMATLLLSAQVQKRDVDIKTPDGVLLRATYFTSAQKGPAVLLLHQCSMNRHAWDDLGSDLATAGVHMLAFDYRGYGDTKGTLPPAPPAPQQVAGTGRKFAQTTSGGWVANRDVELAYTYLRSLPDVDKAHVGVGGASCGGEFAADLTIRHPEIKALVLMSTQISGGAAAHIAATPWLAVFGAAAQGDMPTAYEGIQQAISTSKHPKSMMRMYTGQKHGVEMFAEHPELRPLIVNWLQAQLK